MRISKLGGVAAALALMAVPAAGFAASKITPANGQFVAKPSYKATGHKTTAKLTLFVSKGKLVGVDFVAPLLLPIDQSHSHGVANCEAVSEIVTTGYKSKGQIAKDGKFNYTFSAKNFKDKVTVVGRFSDAKHATGKFGEVVDPPQEPGTHCDRGKTSFTATHS